MASLSDGTYWIYSAANTACRVDVQGGSAKDGADIKIHSANIGNAQVFRVRSASGGGKLIISRYSGKAIDVKGGTLSAGTNVQQWRNNGSRAQVWEAVDSGSTYTFYGTSYPAYYLRPYAAQTLSAQAASSANDATIKLAANGTGATQRWVFVPVPDFIDGGVYEIHSVLDQKMCVSVASASKTKGANVILYTSNGGNEQKFAIYNEGNGYSIRSINSDMFVDVAGGAASTSGTNVQQWTDNDSRAQRWSFANYGTLTYKGAQCQVVELGAGNATTCLMDVTNAKTTNSTNIRIWTANHTNGQKFFLYKTDAQDPKLPAPTKICVASNSSTTYSVYDGTSVTLDVAWTSPSSWVTSGAAHFEHSIRKRTMAPGGTWGEWSEWSQWEQSFVTQSGTRSVLEGALTHEMDKDTAIAAQWQVSVRSVGTDESGTYPANVHGVASTETLTLYCRPTVTFSNASWSPLGLSIDYMSDWDASELKISTRSQWHKQHQHAGGKSGTVRVPFSELSGVPSDGAQMALKYRTGTAQMGAFPEESASLTVSRQSGSVTTTQTSDGYAKYITISGSGTKRAWLYHNSEFLEIPVASNGRFDVPYPMGVAYSVYVALGYTVKSIDMPATEHTTAAWTVDGVSYYAPLVISDTFKRTIKQSANKSALDSRPEMVTDFGPTRTTDITTSVRLYGLDGEMSVEEAKALVGTHGLYRAPDGKIERVSIDSVSESIKAKGVHDMAFAMTKETP